jgi:hypothetical protein
MILKKLNNVDVLYSLLDINNERLNALVQENAFTNILKFVSIHNFSLIDRFYNDILPRIHRDVKCFILDSTLIECILRVTDYPNLTDLKIFDFDEYIALEHFTSKHLI